MARTLTVITPENIPVTLELAGIGTRFGAFLFDILVQTFALLTILLLGTLLASVMGEVGLSNVMSALIVALVFVVFFGYYIFFEALWSGQTPGKRVFGLRTIRDGGFPVDFFSVAARNLVRIADFMPLFYTAGALSIFFNAEYKRFGDMVAGTVVVKEPEAFKLGFFTPAKPASGASPAAPAPFLGKTPAHEALTPAELTVLEHFDARRYTMISDDSERLAYRLVAPLVGRLGITFLPGAAPRYADLASALVREAQTGLAEETGARR